MLTVPRFDLTGPLPRGVTVLEASAGTGKTYTIAGLVTRYVAQGLKLPRLLVVTFTRAATAELRERVRARLVEAAGHLEQHLDGGMPDTDDAVLSVLSRGSMADLRARHRRLAVALTEFDAATVATIHGFCQQVLGGIGLAGDVDRAPTLLEDQTDIVEAVVDDLFVRTFHRPDGQERLRRGDVLKIAQAVVENPDARVVPADADDPTAALRLHLAHRIRTEVDRRKRALAALSYDDLLTRLADALKDPVHGATVRSRLQAKYDVALIDEFQDTDPIQWDIVREVFGAHDRALVLIGDPKQAIYAFRGADVHAYLEAAREASAQATLDVNWRSDGPLLHAYNTLFEGAELGHPEIAYRPVSPAPAHRAARLVGAPTQTPLQIRLVRRDGRVGETDFGNLQASAARAHIARDLAAHVVALLEADAEILERRADGTEGARRRVMPPDIAVLVRSNSEATLVQRTLREAGVPAVINGVGSVFATTAAQDWLRLLEALERPSSGRRARAAALTAFLGWSADRVAAAEDDEWETVHEQLHAWAAILRERSVASLLRTITWQQGLPGRLLAQPGGERALTDLEHVGELLHTAAVAEELGVTALTGWLSEHMTEADEDTNPEERARRLESDAEAVQVLTIHRSKGLEFPIVLAPFLWSTFSPPVPVPVCHTGGGRIVDVAGSGADYDEHVEEAKAEERGESLRLLYVALTRARHQTVVWWAPVGFGGDAPLSRVLFCRSRNGRVLNAAKFRLSGTDDVLEERLSGLLARADGTIGVAHTDAWPRLPRWAGAASPDVELAAAVFQRPLDHRWRRTSYSGITADSHGPTVGSEADEPVVDDEALEAPSGDVLAVARGGRGGGAGAATSLEQAARGEATLRALTVPLADVPGGTDMGTFVHNVLERTDFSADDLSAELTARVREQRDRRHVMIDDPTVLVEGLRRAIETPLGPLVADVALRDLSPRDRLDELQFELPLAGGRSPTGTDVAVAAIGDLLAQHLPATDPLAGYGRRLSDPAFRRRLRGYLTGSIDLVLRLRGDDGTPRFAVADYKTNRLAPFGETLSAWHYRPAALVDGMERGHYPLQALLYVVALHRYLRWRLAGYDPERNLAGALYLFVRGMTGADVPRDGAHPHGVFAWRPPVALVTDLSDLLDRGRAAA